MFLLNAGTGKCAEFRGGWSIGGRFGEWRGGGDGEVCISFVVLFLLSYPALDEVRVVLCLLAYFTLIAS